MCRCQPDLVPGKLQWHQSVHVTLTGVLQLKKAQKGSQCEYESRLKIWQTASFGGQVINASDKPVIFAVKRGCEAILQCDVPTLSSLPACAAYWSREICETAALHCQSADCFVNVDSVMVKAAVCTIAGSWCTTNRICCMI